MVEKVTVSDVDVAALTVPTAPLLNATALLPAVVLKPVPAINSVVRSADKIVVLAVTTGFIKATCTAIPLLTPFLVTTAVKFPAVGAVEKVTVNAVAVAAVTVPTASLLNTTVLLLGVASKPKPLIVMVVEVKARLAILVVTTGTTFAICNAVPLLTPFVVTTALRLPTDVAFVEKITVSVVAVAAVTVPAAPKLNATVLLPGVVSNPKPLIVRVVALAVRFAMLRVKTGLTVATCTGEPVLTPLITTVAMRLPALGLVETVTVSIVADAAVTVPTAPPLKITALLDAKVSNPKPLIDNVVPSAPRLAVLLVTIPMTLATCKAAPLESELVVTTAVRLPTAAGLTANATVRLLTVAVVTIPMAPLLNTTVLREAVVSKPKPLMIIVDAFMARLDVLLVTTGVTVAI